MAYDIYFRPKPGRFGSAPELYSADILGEATTIANSSTTTFSLGLPFRKVRAFRGNISQRAVIVVASGAATVQLQRKPSGSAINLFGTLDASVMTAGVAKKFPQLATQKDGDLLFQEGDTALYTVVTTATVNTQPVGWTVSLECTSID
jgi:hypothetical protein